MQITCTFSDYSSKRLEIKHLGIFAYQYSRLLIASIIHFGKYDANADSDPNSNHFAPRCFLHISIESYS